MREHLTADGLANEIRMTRSADLRAVVIVEGSSDARFFETFLDGERCRVTAGHDRPRALAILRILNQANFHGVLAIIDADFGRVAGTLETDPDLLFCDGHDLEMMLVRSSALDRVVRELGSAEKLAAFHGTIHGGTLATFLARQCWPLGVLLLVSLQQDYGLAFDGLPFADFVDRKTLAVKPDKLIEAVVNKAKRHDLQRELAAEIGRRPLNNEQIWDMARGPDCIELLSFALASAIGSAKRLDGETVRTALRLAFRPEDFAATELCQELRAWSGKNGDFAVISGAD